MVTLQTIQKARLDTASLIKQTPLVRSEFLSNLSGGEVFLKLENLQITNSFKPRGAVNRLLHLSAEEEDRGIITASAGNHGQGVAYAAQKLGLPAKVVVPKTTPHVKIEGIRKFGAELVLFGDNYDEAECRAKELARRDGCAYISPYDDELIISGHGTVGLEIVEACPGVDVVVVPVGGGGLISGVSIAVKSTKPEVEIVGVQSEASPVMYESLKAGRIVEAPKAKTIAEGLSGGIEKGSLTFEIVKNCIDRMLLVKESTIRRAVHLLWTQDKQVAEGSGAAAIAPILENNAMFKGKAVVCLITGGNIDDDLFKEILASEG
jgi:threonine dehydratase